MGGGDAASEMEVFREARRLGEVVFFFATATTELISAVSDDIVFLTEKGVVMFGKSKLGGGQSNLLNDDT
jgi:hypothetical protein